MSSKDGKRRSISAIQPPGTFEYIVKDSDTLRSIAAFHEVNLTAIKQANKLMSDIIFPEQKLYIPSPDYSVRRKSTVDVTDNMMRPGHAERQRRTTLQEVLPPRPLSIDELAKIDEECHHRFVKMKAVYILGDLRVSGVLLVTPDGVMFDPDAHDPVVMEKGVDDFQLVDSVMSVISISVFHNDDLLRDINEVHPDSSGHPDGDEKKRGVEGGGGGDDDDGNSFNGINVVVGHNDDDDDDECGRDNDDESKKATGGGGDDDDGNSFNGINVVVGHNDDDDDDECGRDNDDESKRATGGGGDDDDDDADGGDDNDEGVSNKSQNNTVPFKTANDDGGGGADGSGGGGDGIDDGGGSNDVKVGGTGNSCDVTDQRAVEPEVTKANAHRAQADVDVEEEKIKGKNDKDQNDKHNQAAKNQSYHNTTVCQGINNKGFPNSVEEEATKNLKGDVCTTSSHHDEAHDHNHSSTPVHICLKVHTNVDALRTFKDVGKHKRLQHCFAVACDRTIDQLYAFFKKWSPSLVAGTESDEYYFVEVEAGSNVSSLLEEGERREGGWMKNLKLSKDWQLVSAKEYRRLKVVLEVQQLPLPDLSTPSLILTPSHLKTLACNLPALGEGMPWHLCYSSDRDGFSLHTLYRKMPEHESIFILLIQDTHAHIFGAVLVGQLRVQEHFQGSGESYLFTLQPEFKRFNWTGINNFFFKGNPESIVIGASEGNNGLWLDGELYHGRTQECQTFDNEALTTPQDFVVQCLEVWALK